MIAIDKDISRRIASIGFVCALLVVVIHCKWPHAELSVSWFMYYALQQGIAAVAVPFFFLISGFFLARRFDDPGWWRRAMISRFGSLVVPYFLWLAIAYVVQLPREILAMRNEGIAFGSMLANGNWVDYCGFNLFRPPYVVPLWYVRSLVLFVLLAPMIKAVVEKLGLWAIVGLYCFAVSRHFWGDHQWYMFFKFFASASGLLYFCVGFVVCQKRWREVPRKTVIFVSAVTLAIKLVVAYYCGDGRYSEAVTEMCIPVWLLLIWTGLEGLRLPRAVTRYSFPIYIIHYMLMFWVSSICCALSMSMDIRSWLILVISTGGSVAFALLLSRAFPQTAKILFGGRL